jgi:hypothetical protein
METMMRILTVLLVAMAVCGCAQRQETAKPSQATSDDAVAALAATITFYRNGDVDGVWAMASRRDARLMWVPKDPADSDPLTRMRDFGEFLATKQPRWARPTETEAIASFGPENQAYHLRFVRKNGKWLLDDVNGGD